MNTAAHCPVTQARGKLVGTATIKCLLAVSLAALTEDDYFFCDDPACEVVYFNRDGSSLFRRADVRERVYQKEPDSADVLVCSCFQYTRGQVLEGAQKDGGKAIVDDITAHIQMGRCACDWRNPQGTCCLGNVRRLMTTPAA